MPSTTRATVYLDAALHQALRLKAAATCRSMSVTVEVIKVGHRREVYRRSVITRIYPVSPD